MLAFGCIFSKNQEKAEEPDTTLVVDEAGTISLGDQYKEVIINVPGVQLENGSVDSILVAEGVGDGEVTLLNVKSKELKLQGGGPNSITIAGSSEIQSIRIERVDGAIRVVVIDSSSVESTTIYEGSQDVILEGNFDNLTIEASDIDISIKDASIDSLSVTGTGTTISVDEKSTIQTATILEGADDSKIVVDGSIENLTIEAKDSAIEVNGEVGSIDVKDDAENASINVNEGALVKSLITMVPVTLDGEGTLNEVSTNLKSNLKGNANIKEIVFLKDNREPVVQIDSDSPPLGAGRIPSSGTGGTTPSTGTGGTTPSTVAVNAITINKTTTTLTVGETETLVATIAPADATNKTITWSSSDKTIATVDTNGKVKAIAKGKATITATSVADGTIKAKCDVTVKEVKPALIPVDGISVNKEEVSLAVGNTETLVATVEPSTATNKTVTWSSSDEDVATVADGIVTGKKGGYTTITATTVDGGYTATKHVVVGDHLVLAHGNIQNIINRAESGDIIAVAPGEYREQLEVDKPLTLLGPNAGITGYNVRNGEATITYPEDASEDYLELISIAADDVTVSGFTLDDGDYNEDIDTNGITAHGNSITIRDNILDGFNRVQVLITSYVWNEETKVWETEFCNGALVEGNYAKNALDFTSIYLQGTSGTVKNNTLENAYRAIQIQPYGNPTDGTVENNILSGFRTGIYYNYANKGAGSWSIKDNIITATVIPTDFPDEYKPSEWAGIEVQTFGASGTGEAPSVLFKDNSVDGASASEDLMTVGVLMTGPIGDDATATFEDNTFTNVDLGAQRNAGLLDLDGVLDVNIFPEGSMVIGDEIKVLEEGKIYNATKGDDYETPQAAINEATTGDTILVGDGEYEEDLTIDKPITLESVNGAEQTTIIGKHTISSDVEGVNISEITFKPSENTSDGTILDARGTKNVTIKSSIFDGGQNSPSLDYKVNAIYAGDNMTIEDTTIKNGFYVSINGYPENLTIKNSTITNVKSGINAMGGDNLVVEDTDIDVVVQGKANSTYCVRFASSGSGGSGMSISGGILTVDQNNIEYDVEEHSAIVVRAGAQDGNYIVSGATINGSVWDAANKLDLSAVKTNNSFPEGYEVIGNKIIIPAAHIRGIPYGTIQSAIDEAVADDTIELLGDISIEDTLEIRKQITLEGNGFTINATDTNKDGSKNHAIKIDSLGSGTEIKNVTIKTTAYTGDIIYVSTGKNVKIEDSHLESTDNKAMGIYFDKTSSGSAIGNTITARKGIGADTAENVTINNNTLNFTNMGLELHDGNNTNTVVIRSAEEEEIAKNTLNQYTLSKNVYNVVGDIINNSQNKGYDTIQAAVKAASAEDTILVSAGTYEVNSVININKDLIITGEAGVIFESTGSNSILQPSDGAKLTISNIDFKGTKAVQQRAIDMVANTEVIVSESTFDTLVGGIYANPGAKITVTGSRFSNIVAAIGTDTAAENLNISGNIFESTCGEAVGFTAKQDTEANFTALKTQIIAGNTGATEKNVTAYGTFKAQ